MSQTLGERIASLRKKAGLTQEELAEKLGISPQAVSKWENDLSCPDVMSLRPLANLFGVTADELLAPGEISRAEVLPEVERKNVDDMMLRIYVNDNEDKVKLNIPILLLKAFMGEDGKLSDGINMNFGRKWLNGIDFQSIITAASMGTVGKLLEMESDDGTTVDIYIE